MKKLTVLALVTFVFTSAIYGQLQEADTASWQFNAALTGRLNTGNVERFLISPDISLTHIAKSKKYGFALGERYTYGTFGKFRTENDLLSRNFFYLNPNKRFYPYAMLWMQTHKGQQLQFRYQAGIGITYVPLRKNGQLIKLSLTGTFEQNNYNATLLTIENTTAGQYNTFRATGRIYGNHRIAKNLLEFYYEGYFQQSVSNAKNWRIYAEAGLNIKVIKGFSMKSYLSYEYQTVHVLAVKPNDLILTFGLNYRLVGKN